MTEVTEVAEAPEQEDAPPEETSPGEEVVLTPEQMAPKSEPEPEEDEDKVLDLTTLAPSRRLVKLPTPQNPKGETFELRLLDDFGVRDQQRLLSWSKKFESLFNKEEELTDNEAERMVHCLNQVFERVLDAPENVKKKMPETVRTRVMTGFSIAPLLARQEAALEERKKQILAQLVDRGLVTQDQIDEIVNEIEKSTSEN